MRSAHPVGDPIDTSCSRDGGHQKLLHRCKAPKIQEMNEACVLITFHLEEDSFSLFIFFNFFILCRVTKLKLLLADGPRRTAIEKPLPAENATLALDVTFKSVCVRDIPSSTSKKIQTFGERSFLHNSSPALHPTPADERCSQ